MKDGVYTGQFTVVDASVGQTVLVNVDTVVATLVTVEVWAVAVLVLLAVTVLLFVAMISIRTPQVTVYGWPLNELVPRFSMPSVRSL